MTILSDIILKKIRFFSSIISSFPFLFIATSIALSLKLFILLVLIKRGKQTKAKFSWYLLLLVLVGAIISDFSWLFKLSQLIFFSQVDYRFLLFFIRIAWAFFVIQYQALAIFTENLVDKKPRIKFYQKITLSISLFLVLFFIGLAFYQFNCLDPRQRPNVEADFLTMAYFYALVILSLSLFVSLWKIRKNNLPKILKKQLKVLIQFIILPLLASEFIQFFPFDSKISLIITNSFFAVGFSTILMTYALFHCMRKIMGFRFLNFQKHVQAPTSFNFIDDFKSIIQQFSQVTSEKELSHIIQNFFREAFGVVPRGIHFYFRSLDKEKKFGYTSMKMESDIESEIENFMSLYACQSQVGRFIGKTKVIIRDELEFSNFYEDDEVSSKIIDFMNKISADIFIPIFERENLIACIVVEKDARISQNKCTQFYSNVERDQMEIFASYIANVIKILQNKNLDTILSREKELKEELYRKHQENNKYRESIKSFIRKSSHKKVGIIFYKNRRFTFGNQVAHELIPVKLNKHIGHPITQKLKKVVTQVLEYNTPQKCFVSDKNGEKIIVFGFLSIEQNNVILLTYYPEISDIIKNKVDLLKDPSRWDYILYLETTASGKLINQLIPGDGELLLNFKIDLLKVALSKKATLLDIPDSDLLPTVQMLHHISLRDNLHILDLKSESKSFDTAIKLFGINSLFGMNNEKKPILERLDKNGTLFIKNIHFLDLETQNYLAEFIKFGFFRVFKGNQKTYSDVRIICSANTNLEKNAQKGIFSKELLNELQNRSISMPSIISLPEQEIVTLTTGFTEQVIENDEFKPIFQLTQNEQQKLYNSKPTSIAELKDRVQQLLMQKSKNNEIYEEAQFDPAYATSDPELVEAARLGKYALRDKKIMTLLWNKFKSQNKIANFLGVNRSSVNRRCKEYDLD